ncbi:hypothetical protein, partial [Lacticaseibacillus paracasei]|uniref:hypothetical protein n=1 Tax=Lacticaseibacillus paracasei TaxID=1597 RepID=UPI0021A3F81D
SLVTMRNMVSKNVGKPTILHCHFPTFYDRHLQSFKINVLSPVFALAMGRTISTHSSEWVLFSVKNQ